MSVAPPNAPPRQSRRQGQRIKRPLAVYNLCLELDDGKMLVIISVLASDGWVVLPISRRCFHFMFHLYTCVDAHAYWFNCFGTCKEARRATERIAGSTITYV